MSGSSVGALEPQAELGDAAFEKFLIAQRRPIGRFHFAHDINLSRLRKMMMQNSCLKN